MKITRFIKNFFARIRLSKFYEINIDSTSKIQYAKIRYRNNCKLVVGKKSMIGAAVLFDRDGASIAIGDRTFIGESTIISASQIEIGDDVLISWGCTIVDHNSHSVVWRERASDVTNWRVGHKDWSSVKIAPVSIGNKAWLGFNVSVLCGVSIGEGAVVGAGSIVTRDVPPYTLVAGNPARVIREIPLNER